MSGVKSMMFHASIDTSTFSNWILVVAPGTKLLSCIDLDKK